MTMIEIGTGYNAGHKEVSILGSMSQNNWRMIVTLLVAEYFWVKWQFENSLAPPLFSTSFINIDMLQCDKMHSDRLN